MNISEFQTTCINQCEASLVKAGLEYSEPILIKGKKERYFIIGFILNKKLIELYIYADEAGLMLNHQEWTVFEKPDFDDETMLLAAYISHLDKILKTLAL